MIAELENETTREHVEGAKASTGASAFDSEHQIETMGDFPKRVNDNFVQKNVIWPFVNRHEVDELRAVTLPGAAPVWEYGLYTAKPEGEKQDGLSCEFFMVEGDKDTYDLLNNHVQNTKGRNNLRRSFRQLHTHCKTSRLDLRVASKPLLLDEAFTHPYVKELPDNLNMLYADLCGPWSDWHLRLLNNVNEAADRFDDHALFGVTINLQRADNGGAHVIAPLLENHEFEAEEIKMLQFDPCIGLQRTPHQVKHCLGGSKVVAKCLDCFHTELKFVRVYRRYSEFNHGSPMATLWFEISKN